MMPLSRLSLMLDVTAPLESTLYILQYVCVFFFCCCGFCRISSFAWTPLLAARLLVARTIVPLIVLFFFGGGSAFYYFFGPNLYHCYHRRYSDLASHSRRLSPLPATVRAVIVFARRPCVSVLFATWTRAEGHLPTLRTHSSSFLIFIAVNMETWNPASNQLFFCCCCSIIISESSTACGGQTGRARYCCACCTRFPDMHVDDTRHRGYSYSNLCTHTPSSTKMYTLPAKRILRVLSFFTKY